ncbi:hypothetical protein LguiA_010935 [Lonicera macranthoides]
MANSPSKPPNYPHPHQKNTSSHPNHSTRISRTPKRSQTRVRNPQNKSYTCSYLPYPSPLLRLHCS